MNLVILIKKDIIMQAVINYISEEKIELKERRNVDLKVKMLSHAETKSLQDDARIKYKKAFEILNDK